MDCQAKNPQFLKQAKTFEDSLEMDPCYGPSQVLHAFETADVRGGIQDFLSISEKGSMISNCSGLAACTTK